MKTLSQFLLLFFFLFSCGSDSDSISSTSSGALSSGSEFQSVSIIIPNSELFGATADIEIDGKRYKVGSKTANWILNELDKLPYGLHQREIQGETDFETGLFPNPTAQVNVVHIYNIR